MAGICVVGLVSCEQKKNEAGPEAPSYGARPESRKQNRSARLTDLLQQSAIPGPDGGRAANAMIANLLAEAIHNHDEAEFRELVGKFDKELFGSRQDIGVALADSLKPDEWNEALNLLGDLRSADGLQVAAGLAAKSLILAPGRGEELLQSKAFSSFTGGVTGDPRNLVWTQIGLLLVEDGKNTNLQQILAMASPLDASGRKSSQSPLAYLSSGLSIKLALNMKAGDSDSLREFGMLFPEAIRVDVIGHVLNSSGVKFDANNLPVVQAVLDNMKSTPGFTAENYFNLGTNMSRDVFEKVLLQDPALESSDQLKQTVKGWVSIRPKSSVELVLKTGRQDLLRPAFSQWMDKDSMEASQWLRNQPAGQSRDLCVEELCVYLSGTDSRTEAASWLSELPPDKQDALKKKYRFE
ncbi:MAG: hypothetical protein QM755_20295 [Luteolibacter sp.]